MLVLSRDVDEQIVLDAIGQPPIVITILRVSADTVRVGIEAPPHYEVHRREVWERIHGRSLPTAATKAKAKGGNHGKKKTRGEQSRVEV